MASRPLVGLTTSVTFGSSPERAYVNAAYVRAVQAAGGAPVLLPPHLDEATGATKLEVNSFHHQAIKRLGAGLREVAWAEDGIIEAVEMDGAHSFVLGVQWHPEDLIERDTAARALFAAVVDAARRRTR